MENKELKEFWEWCGFRLEKQRSGSMGWTYPPVPSVYAPMGLVRAVLPDLDLNNLFKYAVPKAVAKIAHAFKLSIQSAYKELFRWWLEELLKDPAEPAQALYQAINKLRKENER